MKKMCIAVKTFNRIHILKTTLQQIKDNTDMSNTEYEFIVSCDDQESIDFVKKEFPEFKTIGGDRAGSGGNTQRIFDYVKGNFEYFCIFEDECYPIGNDWLPIFLEFFEVPDNKIQYIVHGMNLDNGVYKEKRNEKFYGLFKRPLRKGKVGRFNTGDYHYDSAVFMGARTIILNTVQINLEKFNKNYGYWHTDFARRVQLAKLTPYRTTSVIELDKYIAANDFAGLDTSGSISEVEKQACLKEYKTKNISWT